MADGSDIEYLDIATPNTPSHLSPQPPQAQASKDLPLLSLAEVEAQHIQRILHHCSGNRSAAARPLEVLTSTNHSE